MMPIVLRAESPTDGQLQVEAPRHASTQPITNTEVRADGAHGASGGPGGISWRSRYIKGGGRGSVEAPRHGVRWALLFVLIPALIISVLREVCRTSPSASTDRTSGVSARRLSDGDEGSKESSTLSQLAEECEAVETHLGLASNEESSPAEDLAAAEQVAKIAFELYQESHAFEQQLLESQRAGQRSVFPLGSSPAISGIDHQHQHMQGAVNMAAPEYGYGGPLHLTSDLAAPHSQPGGLPPEPFATSPQAFAGVSRPCFSGTQLYSAAHLHFGWTPQAAFASLHPDSAASQSAAVLPPVAAPFPVGLPSQAAWLLPQGGAQRNPRKRTYSEGPEEAYPGLEPDSWLDNVPVIDGSQEVQRQSQAVSLNFPSSDQAAPCSYAACQFSAGAESSGDASRSTSTTSPGGAGEASTATSAEDGAGVVSAAAGAAEPAAAGFQPSWVFRHPFVHSPVLQEGVVAPLIRLSPSNFQESKGSTVRGILAAIRCLFMMQTLDYMDALVLVEHVQELAVLSAARARQAKRMRRALHGMLNIGQQFLALDAIVSAMHVLGQQPSSCSWWEAFANCFDTSFRYPEPISRSQESARVNIDLANRMLAAMSIYKTGNRPQFEEIIDLKRILFFSRYAPLYFRSFKWKAWRDDYLMFEKEHPSFSEWLQKRRHLPK